jgi:hypothetical protein
MAFVRSYSCPECGFELADDGRLFYYDSDSKEIIEYLLLMSTVDRDKGSKIKGDVSETYCKTCDRYILVYSIREAEGDIEDLCETVMKGIEKHINSCHEELKRMNDIKAIKATPPITMKKIPTGVTSKILIDISSFYLFTGV